MRNPLYSVGDYLVRAEAFEAGSSLTVFQVLISGSPYVIKAFWGDDNPTLRKRIFLLLWEGKWLYTLEKASEKAFRHANRLAGLDQETEAHLEEIANVMKLREGAQKELEGVTCTD